MSTCVCGIDVVGGIMFRQQVAGCGGCVWGTTYHITYKADADLHDSIISVMRAVEHSLSPFSGQSLISRINRGEDVEADTLIEQCFAGRSGVWTFVRGI